MQHIKTKKRTVHARPMTVLSPGDLARAVGGGIIVHEATGILVPQATGIIIPQATGIIVPQ